MVSEGVRVASDPVVMERAAIERLGAAWAEFSGSGTPEDVMTLRGPRDEGKSVVYGLGPSGPGGKRVVAKELLAEAADVELTMYREVLPRLSLRGPELFGVVDSIDPDRVWLFLEEIAGPPLDKTDPVHMAIASRWLAVLHTGTASGTFSDVVPGRQPDFYLSLMSRVTLELAEVSASPAIDPDGVRLLQEVSGHLERILSSADGLAKTYRSQPSAVVHGDFKANNMAFSAAIDPDDLRVFDWSEAHRGPMAVDLWRVELSEYRAGWAGSRLMPDPRELEEWRTFGALLRWVSAVSWEIPRLRYEWTKRPLRHMSTYEKRLRLAIEGSGWLS